MKKYIIKKILPLTLIIVLMFCFVVPMSSFAASTEEQTVQNPVPIMDGMTYAFKNVATEKCMTVGSAATTGRLTNTTNNVFATSFGYTGNVYSGDSTRTFLMKSTGGCLLSDPIWRLGCYAEAGGYSFDVCIDGGSGQTPTTSKNVSAFSTNLAADNYSDWIFVESSSIPGAYYIKLVYNSNLVLTANTGEGSLSAVLGAEGNIIVSPYTGANNQLWYARLMFSYPSYTIKGEYATPFYLSMSTDGLNAMMSSQVTNSAKFKITYNTAIDAYEILSLSGMNLCIDTDSRARFYTKENSLFRICYWKIDIKENVNGNWKYNLIPVFTSPDLYALTFTYLYLPPIYNINVVYADILGNGSQNWFIEIVN